ncbi:hypothetical protein LCGC14_2653890 [marine sediment metagenome]|uniref:PLAT domain-containing protein n=1 Tax=marine sediment metagenome TaxID=412755 RepID=A0A0F8ZTZ7_9ZZZZ
MRFSELFSIVHCVKSADHGSGVDSDSINMGQVHNVIFTLSVGSVTGDAVLKLYSGATNGTKTTAETFNYRLASADQGTALTADQYGAWTTSAALTLTAATYDNKILLVELKAEELTDGQEWLTMEISSAASNIFVSVVAYCRGRFQGFNIPTVLG